MLSVRTLACPLNLPGIKGEARRAAPDRPLGRALLQRHQQNFGGRC